MLAAVRSALDHCSQALLCVAFAQTRGVHLLAKELERASARGNARVMVTTFGSTAPAALAAIRETGADLRVLNPVGGTYHPKVYLGRTANSIHAGLDEPIEPELLAMLAAVARDNPRVYTLGSAAAENVVADVTASGLWVKTARSRERSTGAQLVPPRMLNLAWDTLRARGRLSKREMLEELRIHRSSFVCAVLARLPGVTVDPGRTIVLRYSNPAEV